MDFRSPDYDPLDGFVGFNLPITEDTGDSINEKEAFGEKIYSDVSLYL